MYILLGKQITKLKKDSSTQRSSTALQKSTTPVQINKKVIAATKPDARLVTPHGSQRKPLDISPHEARTQTRQEILTMNKVRKVLGKFLSKTIIKQDGRSWLVSTISDIVKEHPVPMKKCNISFSIEKDAIEHNDKSSSPLIMISEKLHRRTPTQLSHLE